MEGAVRELELSPKPGLVDVFDHGSHPDLSYNIMVRSIGLLELYFAEMAGALRVGTDVSELRKIAIRAEERMMRECGSNTHRGYIFLGGILLISALCFDNLREGIKETSAMFLETVPTATKGSGARAQYKVKGIIGECLLGLPAVFDEAIPAYTTTRASGEGHSTSAYYAMGMLMQIVEDTTALHRCGEAGLNKLKRDGLKIEECVMSGGDVQKLLRGLNKEFVEMNLTMGGVADLIAVTFAVCRIGQEF